MTAPAPLDLPSVLDELERAHAAATPGPWSRDDGYLSDFVHAADGAWIGQCNTAATAAAIVAAVNAVPTLIAELRKRDAALKAVLALADFADGTGRAVFGISDGGAVWVRDIRACITATLSPESVQS